MKRTKSQAMMGNKNASRSTENKIQALADKKWSEMIRALDTEGADIAFDIFIETMRQARLIKKTKV